MHSDCSCYNNMHYIWCRVYSAAYLWRHKVFCHFDTAAEVPHLQSEREDGMKEIQR